jgi:hypothetical protein
LQSQRCAKKGKVLLQSAPISIEAFFQGKFCRFLYEILGSEPGSIQSRGRIRLQIWQSSFKGEGSTNFMSGLVQVLGVEGGAETKSGSCAEFDIVGESGDATVVDLGLRIVLELHFST